MEATRSRLVARRSRSDHSLRVPHYPEDPTTQPTLDVHGLNPDLARRFHNVRSSSNVVDFSTNSNVQLVHDEEEEAVELMNSNHHHQQDYYYFDHIRRYNINPQQYCTTNWPSDDQLSNIDHYSHAMSSSNAHQEGLSLSLSSNPYSNNNYIVKADTRQQQQHYNLGFLKYSNIHNVVGGGGKEYGGNALQADVMTTLGGPQWRSSGPLGPFTGYATILKSSKFLKPAQDLLDELCDFPGHHHEPVETMQTMLQRIADESSIMSTGDIGGWSSSSSNNSSFAVEYQQKKTALFYMSDEVCRRYKHYYQQMQMVVSSFEAVAALSASTPYISLALKAVARNFRCLKNAISEQLRNVKNSLMMMEDTNCSIKVNNPRSCLQRRSRTSLLGSNTTAFFNAQSQYGCRPQRGLPERSVAILRAWLFEHFLHPYPSDTDKHMLANQTGLSRNQVSNWFINARVRLWRPMVEEIHELETKAKGQGHDSNPNKKHHVVHNDSISIQRDNRNANPPPTESAANEPIRFSGIGGSSRDLRDDNDGHHVSWQWDPEIRSGLECHHQVPISMEQGSNNLIGFERYQPQSSGGVDQFGGSCGRGGAVSLSLGLMHNVGGSQQQQHDHVGFRQQQQQHFGGDMMCD